MALVLIAVLILVLISVLIVHYSTSIDAEFRINIISKFSGFILSFKEDGHDKPEEDCCSYATCACPETTRKNP